MCPFAKLLRTNKFEGCLGITECPTYGQCLHVGRHALAVEDQSDPSSRAWITGVGARKQIVLELEHRIVSPNSRRD